MRKLRILAFVLMVYVWSLSFLIVSVGLFSEQFDYQFNQAVTNVAILVMMISQVVWGIVAGIVNYYRGWEVTGKWTNLPAMIFLESTMFVIPSMVLAWRHYPRTGKFFPAPEEC
jgi:hypothetical protein